MSDHQFETPERFWSKIDVGEIDECWEWLVSKFETGYGQFWIRKGQLWLAHRVAWTLTYGPIPQGLYVCHHCDNKSCCNPYHLFLGTNKGNQIDSVQKGHWAGKLTKGEVLDIRQLYSTGKWSQQDLADAFDVTPSSISLIVLRKTWGWL